MNRRILNVRVTQPVIDRLESLAHDIGYSRAELARWVLVTGCDEGRLPPGYREMADARQARELCSMESK